MGTRYSVMNENALYVLPFLIKFCLTFRHEILVSSWGTNRPDCLLNSSLPCKTLDYVLANIVKASQLSFRNSTKIQVQGNQTLQENYNLKELNNFTLCGGSKTSVITCISARGLIILESTNIVIQNLTFLNCGSHQTSPTNVNISFPVGIYLSIVTNITLSGCTVSNSSGIGMVLLNVGGLVTFNYTIFKHNKKNSTSRKKIVSGLADVGGGLIIQLFDHKTRDDQSQFSDNNKYYFYHCSFLNNGCTWNPEYETEPTEADRSVIFGCGGGLAISLKGQFQRNVILLQNCDFTDNLADWGGGYYFLLQDKSFNNCIHFANVSVSSNHGVFAGGGGRFIFLPHVNHTDHVKLEPNYFKQEFCTYTKNYAGWGGGVAVFGSTVYQEDAEMDKSLSFSNCTWTENQAVVGSALGFLSNSIQPQEVYLKKFGNGIAFAVKLMTCQFAKNKIYATTKEYGQSFIGTGTIYVDLSPITMKNVLFAENNGTPLVLDLSDAIIHGNVTFYRNTGNEGGAISLYGRSQIILYENSSLTFNSNSASLRGGAVFASSQGPNLKAFQVHILDRSTCFFSYYDKKLTPKYWAARVIFINNYAPYKSGKSIYANTLQFCRDYGNVSEALEWKPVFIYNSTCDDPDIVTDPATIHAFGEDWMRFPGEHFSPHIKLLDEKKQQTNGLVKLSVESSKSAVKFGSQASELVYVSGERSAAPISFSSNEVIISFNLTISSVYTQAIRATVNNISTMHCYGGYKFDQHAMKCVCFARSESPYGYRCGQDGKTMFLKEGYWAKIGKNGTLLVLVCPLGYCKCANKTSDSSDGKTECIFEEFQNDHNQCAAHRMGTLCGSCHSGYSVVVGLIDCRKCKNTGLILLVPILAGLTIIVLAIIYFELDFFSGPLNCWLYTYHIVMELPYKDKYLDPFIMFVISLTRGTFDISTGRCFWNGMDALQKRALEYIMPFYCFLLLYFVNKILRAFPNLPLSNRSFHHAFVTIVIVSYAALIEITIEILHPVLIDGKLFVFVQGNIKYFGTYHLPFALPALFILFFLVLPFPFVVAFNSFFTQRFRFFSNFLPLFEALQSPYRPTRTWFASYYIFCRLIFITLLLFRPFYERTLFPFYEAICVIILLMFVLLRPYKDENYLYFKVDTCFLSLLCIIICCVNAMEVNDEPVDVKFFQVLVRLLIYIPFLYSMGLLIQYIYQRVKAYKDGRAELYEPLM